MTATRTAKWTREDVPDQHGRVAVVTGANSGIGYEAALVLASRGATVVLACRNEEKGRQAAGRIHDATPDTSVEVEQLDLSSLASVGHFAKQLHATHPTVDLLINNAGVMWTAQSRTEDGFELQFGTNHLGHFALTGQVIDLLLPVPGSRVVTISSFGHRTGQIDFDDLQSDRRYGRHQAYAQSKLANLMFTYELQRRLAGSGANTVAAAAHPGGSSTDLVRNSPAPLRALDRAFGSLVMQPADMGALPTLRAATDPNVKGSDYYGPSGFLELRGAPTRVRSTKRSHDTDAQRRLWQVSEKLTGVAYPARL